MNENYIIINRRLIYCLFFSISGLLFGGTKNHINYPHNTGDFGGRSFFTQYITDDGLALSSVASSITDRFGNIWFGTYGGGASRYDGKSFTNFTTSNGLAGNVILSVFEDRKGNLWFGTNRAGISKYDGRTFTNYTVADGLANNSILSIAQDDKGNLWFGTYGGGVSKYDGKKFETFNSKNGLASDEIRSILVAKNGIIWFGTLSQGLIRYDGKRFTTFTTSDGLAHNSVFNLLEDKDGNLWIGTMGGGISFYDGKSFTNYSPKNGFGSSNIWSSYLDKSGTIWFGSKGDGLFRFNGKNFSRFTTLQGLPHEFIYTITEDHDGNIWLGTYGGGICKYEGDAITSFSAKQGLASNIVFSILQDRTGNFWFGTYGGGISKSSYSKFQKSTEKLFTNYSMRNGLPSNDVKSIFEDRQGNIWFGTIGGGASKLIKGKGNSFITYSVANGLADNKVNCIHEDRKGLLWFGTAGGGVSSFNGKTFRNYTTKNGLANNIVLCMVEDRNNNLWFGTSDGISRFDGINFKTYTTKDGLPSNNVFCIFEDKDGFLWFGTDGGGVSRYDGKSFTNYNKQNGFLNNTVGQILQDKNGKIFFATYSGLAVLTGWNNGKPIFEILNKKTGYNIKDVNAGQKGMYLDRDGIIWIATGEDKTALIRFDYYAVKHNSSTPVPVIQNIKIHEQEVNWYRLAGKEMQMDSLALHRQDLAFYGKDYLPASNTFGPALASIQFDSISAYYPVPQNLVLPYELNQITFEYAVIEPSKPFLVNYQYMLEGYDKDWSQVTGKTSAIFGNIVEGNYTFRLRAQKSFGEWSEPIEYRFKVLPPWYRTLYAYLFYLAVTVLLIYLIIYFYSRRLKRVNIQLEKTIKERTAEIVFQHEELKKHSSQIQSQSLKLAQANSAKDKFFRIIAHDLRSPISGVLKLTDMMANESEEFSISEFNKFSKLLNQSVDNLYKLMNNLLEWATSQQEGFLLELKECNLALLIKENIGSIEERTKQKGINIDNRIVQPVLIRLDEKIINTVIRNLLSNALKFSHPGGTITIDQKQSESEIEVSITDTGIGISESNLNRLFKLDEKVGSLGTDNEPSTGLGLTLCKEFVEKHGGKIWAVSEENVGSTFYFTLPFSVSA